jgi:hypothetical protein
VAEDAGDQGSVARANPSMLVGRVDPMGRRAEEMRIVVTFF